MALNGVNGTTNTPSTFTTTKLEKHFSDNMQQISEDLANGLRGTGNQHNISISAMPENETGNQHNISISAMPENETEKMTHKNAKEWCKTYMIEHNCSKEEAEVAFKEKFGYDIPLSTGQKIGRSLIFAPFGINIQAIDAATGNKLGVNNFINGQKE